MSLPCLPPLHEDWQSVTNIPHCFWHMFDQQMGCDVVFLIGVDQERVGAHSMVLMSRSSVFFKEFSSGVPDKEIFLPNLDLVDFREFMRFLYTGELSSEHYDNNNLMSIAESYNVSELLKLVLHSKLQDIDIEDFCPFVRRYQNHMSGAIKFKCEEFVFSHAEQVFEIENFSVLPSGFVEDIVRSDYLVLNEETICTGVLLWASKACEDRKLEVTGKNQREVLGDILFEVRFPLLKSDFFNENISEKGLLTDTEEVKVLKYLLNPSKCPDNLIFKTQMRSAPNQPFSLPPEIHHDNPDGVSAGPDVTKGTLRSIESRPILHTLHSGRHGIVERFTEQSTGWGYRRNRKDAIAFMVDKDIRLDYVFVYGNCKVDGTMDVSLLLRDNYLELSQTDIKVPCTVQTPYYEIGIENSSGTYGIHLQAKCEYHIILGVKGETGYYGKGGKRSISSEGVNFSFLNSRYSSNNTSVNIGQIAGFRFTVLTEGE